MKKKDLNKQQYTIWIGDKRSESTIYQRNKSHFCLGDDQQIVKNESPIFFGNVNIHSREIIGSMIVYQKLIIHSNYYFNKKVKKSKKEKKRKKK